MRKLEKGEARKGREENKKPRSGETLKREAGLEWRKLMKNLKLNILKRKKVLLLH